MELLYILLIFITFLLIVREFKKHKTENQNDPYLIKTRLEDLRNMLNQKPNIPEFQSLMNMVTENKMVAEKLQSTTHDLKNILSNNQLRGSWGQEIAEDLLKGSGFIEGINYIAQETQESTGTRPDLTVLLPDKSKINIDVKFPFQAFIEYQKTDDLNQQKKHLSTFKSSIKDKINEIKNRGYINPQEKTVDFVIVFIPNEAIFSFICDQCQEECNLARKNKIIISGPFSFIAILRIVQQAYDNFKYHKNLSDIIEHIKEFMEEYEKFSVCLNSLGEKITQASKKYEEVSKTRNNQLTKIIGKIKADDDLMKSDNDSKPILKN